MSLKFYILSLAVLLFSGCTTTNPQGSKIDLDAVILESFDYNNAPLQKVVDDLCSAAILRDPNGPGLIFKVTLDPLNQKPTVTMKLKRVSMSMTIKYLADCTGLKHSIKGNIITLVPILGPIETRVFYIHPTTLGLRPDSSKKDIEKEIRRIFDYADFQQPYQLSYNPKTRLLTATQCSTIMEIMESFLSLKLD